MFWQDQDHKKKRIKNRFFAQKSSLQLIFRNVPYARHHNPLLIINCGFKAQLSLFMHLNGLYHINLSCIEKWGKKYTNRGL